MSISKKVHPSFHLTSTVTNFFFNQGHNMERQQLYWRKRREPLLPSAHDYKDLSKVTNRDHYPFQCILYITDQVQKALIFTELKFRSVAA
ncbi:hypothetical protein E2320_002507 [Naja naja]|nr:hypothetical protein E2320_002507 [Naja naja]